MSNEIAALLAAHEIDLGRVRRDREAPAGYWMACTCGYEWSPSPDNDHHRTHLASVLAERERRVAERTWNEGAQAAWLTPWDGEPTNPYAS